MIGGAAALAAARTLFSAPNDPPATTSPATDYTPVHAPNGAMLPWRIVDGL
jgi:hypothetical protein